MKGKFAILLLAAAFLFGCVACGSLLGDPVMGCWKATYFGTTAQLNLNAGNTCTVSSMNQTIPCTWTKQNDNTVIITANGTSTQFVYNASTNKLSYPSSYMSIEFERC